MSVLTVPHFERARLEAEVRRLTAESEMLRDRLDFFEATIFGGALQFPGHWRLTAKESRLLGILLALNVVSRDAAMTAIYGDDPDIEPDGKIIDVYICHLRRKLRPYGIDIQNKSGTGWWIDQPRRGELRRALKLTRPPWRQDSEAVS